MPVFKKLRKYAFELKSVALSAQTIATYDLVLIATDHDAFNYDLIQAHANLIVDTRGRFSSGTPNVIKA